MLPIVIFIIGCSLTAVITWQVDRSEKRLIASELEGGVVRWVSLIKLSLDKEINLFLSAKKGFEDQITMTPESFALFSNNSLDLYPGMKGLFWIPEVDRAQRARYESIKRVSKPNFFINFFAGPAGFIPSPPTDTHYPIYYSQTRSKSEPYEGWDLNSLTEMQTVFNNSDNTNLSLKFLPRPNFLKNPMPGPPGLDLLVISQLDVLTELPDGSTGPARSFFGIISEGADIFAYFADVPSGDKLTVQVTSIESGEKISILDRPGEGKLLIDYAVTENLINRANNAWNVTLIPTDQYFKEQSSQLIYYVFAFGLGSTLVLVAYLVTVIRRENLITQEVNERTIELQKANAELARLSRIDYLTNVANRRLFEETLANEWARSSRSKTPVTLILIDVDFFKQFNDYYGHIKGDDCLREVATALKNVIHRPADMVARFGGEEFVILLSHTDEKAYKLAEKCRETIENLGIEHKDSAVAEVVTISLGIVTMLPTRDYAPLDLLEAADYALYQAKENGRNQVFAKD